MMMNLVLNYVHKNDPELFSFVHAFAMGHQLIEL